MPAQISPRCLLQALFLVASRMTTVVASTTDSVHRLITPLVSHFHVYNISIKQG